MTSERNYTGAKVARAIRWQRCWAGAALACATLWACSGRKSIDNVYAQGGATGQNASGGQGSAASRPSEAGAEHGGGAGSDDAGPANAGDSGAGGSSESGVDGDLLYFKASNPDAQDGFGQSLALWGDWLAVGAPDESSNSTGIGGDEEDDSGDSSGAVYLFSRQASGWAQRAYVKASNAGSGDGFGTALAFSNGTLAVSAPFEDSRATGIDGAEGNGPGGNQGAVYVFVEANGNWQQQAYVKATNTDAIDLFGSSVALDGDILAVGAPWEDGAATSVDGDQTSNAAMNSGAAYVYERTGAVWQPLAYLKADNAEAEDELGAALAVSGELIAVGAPGESSNDGSAADPSNNAAHEAGAAYVFARAGASYQQVAYLKASNPHADARFGAQLALQGNVLAVSAVGEGTLGGDGSGSNELRPESGAVYVFERTNDAWATYLKAPVVSESAYFGAALAPSGDTLVVGALGDDSGKLPLSGTAYVYVRPAQSWRLQKSLRAPNAELGDRFGSSVALTPTRLAIGAYNEAANVPGMPGAGAAYLYRR